MPTQRGDAAIDACIHAPYKIAMLVRAAQEEGLRSEDVLAGTGLRAADMDDPDTRTSTRQFVLACRNAIELGASPELPFRMGSQVRLSSYGLYGYAMLTSATVREAFQFAVRYHRLTTPTWRMSMHEEGGESVWRFRDLLGLALDDPLYRFLYELQLSAHKSLGKDFFVDPPPTTLSQVRYARPAHAELYEKWLGHPVDFDRSENEFRFSAAMLSTPMPLHHPLTAAMVRDMCDRLLEESRSASGVGRQVYELLTEQPGRFLGMTEVARTLNTSPRTLRRHLAAEGTSYQVILDDVRCRLAKHYLLDTQMTSDDIASALGFSDAANFRHAFNKWTKHSPGEFRRKMLSAAAAPAVPEAVPEC